MIPALRFHGLVERDLFGLSKQATVLANANRAAVIRLDDVMNGAVVGLNLIDIGNLLALPRFLPNRILHVIGQVAKFNLVGVLEIQISISLVPLVLVVVVITVAVAIVVIEV